MTTIWKEPMRVRMSDAGFGGLLKPHAIFQFFQEAAGHHATHLGVGYEELQKLGLIWVLSRIKVEVAELPAWGDEVILTTWPKGVERLFALRDFRMSKSTGKVLACGTSCWLLVGAENLRPRRIESLPPFPVNNAEHALRESLERLALPSGLVVKYERRVMSSDLDVNNHVNNTEYARWIIDCLENDDGTAPPLRSLQINYQEEAKLGDVITFSVAHPEGSAGIVSIAGVSGAKKTAVVQARVGLRL